MRVTAYVGPCAVKQVAEGLRRGGFENVFEGTEHVYFDLDLADSGCLTSLDIKKAVRRACGGTDFGMVIRDYR